MSETEKQDGQKTVVAFIAGLLIGGLLVWVFSSSPADTPTDVVTDDSDVSEVTDDASDTSGTEEETDTNGGDVTVSEVRGAATGVASIAVPSQTAGPKVRLGEITFPTNDGWVAVRDFEDGEIGRILGASRYSVDAGLVPTEVQLLRSTVTGSTYRVVFHTENGDRVFDTVEDTLMPELGATFVAQ